MGWPTGFEPATTSSTSLDSTIELRPPTVADTRFAEGERQAGATSGSASFEFGARALARFGVDW